MTGMKLYFLYGPPAVGKLTIAQELHDLTSIPIFHNHMTRDLVLGLYGKDILDHYDLVETLRNDVLSYCAQHDTDLIFTFVYGGSDDDTVIGEYVRSVESHGGQIEFIELTAKKEDLLDRVQDESRTQHKKLTNPKIMDEITQDMSKYSIPNVDALKIDTSQTSPTEAAKIIASTLSIKTTL